MCVCARLGQPGAIGGGLGSRGRRDEPSEGWRDRRSAGVSLEKVQVWADGQTERWKGELDGRMGGGRLEEGSRKGRRGEKDRLIGGLKFEQVDS